MIWIWIIVFLVALAAMVKGADWFLESAEVIGLALGLSPFVIGIVIIGLGTSLPELISSFAALFQHATEIIAANAVGSNIANIFLVIGISAIIGKKLVVTKSLIDLDAPLFAITTVLFLGVAWDGQVTFVEALLLLVSYACYLAYSFMHKDDEYEELDIIDVLPVRANRQKHKVKPKTRRDALRQLNWHAYGKLIIGLLGLVVGAKYLIDAVIHIATITQIATGVITLFAVALGTSLPEILVSAKAAYRKKSEIALGNVFGSNVFNILVVVGLPGLFSTLTVDTPTRMIGLPMLIAATLLFVISGISRRIHLWEGWLYVVLYVFFIGKLFNLL